MSYKSLSCTATLFLAFWKRHRASYVCEWKVSDWCEEEVCFILYILFQQIVISFNLNCYVFFFVIQLQEELILEIVNSADCDPKPHKHSYLRSTVVLICVTVMVGKAGKMLSCTEDAV